MSMDPNPGGAQGGAPPTNQEPPPNGAPSPEPQRPYVRADQLPDDALKARLEQAKRGAAAEARAAAFKELGVEDPDKFRTEREKTDAELKRYRDAEEKRKRSEMTESQRYKADLERANAEIAELKSRLAEMETTAVYSQQQQVVDEIASKHINPKLLRAARAELAMHLNSLDPKAVDEISDRDIDKWFRKLAQDEVWAIPKPPPAVADPKAAGAPPVVKPPERRVDPVRRPAGTPPPRQGTPKPVVSGAADLKTFKPGQKNSMTKKEVADAMRAQGLKPY